MSSSFQSKLVAEARAVGVVIEVGVGGIGAVVRNAGQRAGLVGAVAHRPPLVADPQMLADAEAQALVCARPSARCRQHLSSGPC